jgi:hypothetical protein
MLFVPALVLCLSFATVSIALAAEDTDSVEDILEVLSERGLIDEATHAKLLSKHNARQASASKDVAASVLGGWQFAGDLRLRWEAFIYDEDATGVEATNRYRLRYRGRLSAQKEIYDWLQIGFRIASDSSDARSTNQTLGSGDDFDTDDLRLDKAWAALTPNLGDDTALQIVGGKMTNPYRWKAGKDLLVWDSDLTLEGAQLLATHRLSERAKVFSHAGYYVAAEESSSSDPKLLAVQGGAIFAPLEDTEVGLRGSGYFWHSLDSTGDPSDPGFVERAASFGNLPSAFDGTKMRIGTASAYVQYAGFEDWPVTVFGTVARNFAAESSTILGERVDDEDLGWIAGLQVGDKKKLAQLGFLYGEIEANALPAQFIDSDFTDGSTNRKGWMLYGTRQIATNVDFNVELFKSDQLEDDGAFNGCRPDCGPFTESVENSDRYRLRTDLIIKFD